MKINTLFLVPALVLALICTACPDVPSDKETPGYSMVGSWTNNETGSNERLFTVHEDLSFSCHMAPAGQGFATVTGNLTYDGDDVYTMSKLKGTPDEGAVNTGWTHPFNLGAFNSQKCLITFYDADSFNFVSATGNAAVTKFFGGDYSRVE